ncbi:MAG: histidine kinase [Burkholderiaceae bacterium]
MGFAAAWALFWLLMLVIAIQDHAREPGAAWWKPLLWEGSSCLAATALLALMWHRTAAADAWLAQPLRWFTRHLVWLPLLAPAFVAAIFGLRHAVYALIGQTYAHAPWREVFIYESTKFSLFYLLFVAVVFGLRTHAAFVGERLRTREAQLAQLTQRLEPHFLFNALNTIAATIHSEPDKADALLTRLAALLRAATDLTRRPTCTLDEELKLLDGYAAIMCERFGDRVVLHWQIDDGARACRVPTLAVQPLLENAFRHAVERSTEPVELWVTAHASSGRLRVEVAQNRGELDAATTPGVGLDTLRQRLQASHGERASVGLAPRAPAGLTAWFELPCER